MGFYISQSARCNMDAANVGIFISIAISLGIGVQSRLKNVGLILGTTNIVDCNALVGSDDTDGSADTDSGWAAECYSIQTQTQQSYRVLTLTDQYVASSCCCLDRDGCCRGLDGCKDVWLDY